MKQKYLFIASMALAGCGSMSESNKYWIQYKDIDQSVKEVSFWSREQFHSPSDVKGTVYQRDNLTHLATSTPLGEIYHIYDVNHIPMNVIFLDTKTQRSLNPQNAQDMAQLSKATQFDFYEFGKGRIAHAVFSAKAGLCQDFKSKRGVALKMATNYYTDDSYKGYYVSVIHAIIRHNGQHTDFAYTPAFSIADTKALAMTQALEKQDGERVAQMNLKEKVTLLTNIVCQ
ncbi:hypothetical protein NMV01_10670 [Pasteurella multocida]|nr:hypothetical protein [Pasteurella multocida]MDY0576828.1 hypothetical protein [Pasteurella multocida]